MPMDSNDNNQTDTNVVQDFLRPRLSGGRFDGHTIPLSFLKDLAVLEDLIIEVAKWKLRQAEDRKRVPRGFSDGFRLTLSEVEEGSAIPVIGLTISAAMAASGTSAYFEQAKQAVVDAISAAESGRSIGDHLPVELLTYFNTFGVNLQPEESIEISAGQVKSRLTQTTRKILALASSPQWTKEIQIRGAVCEVNSASDTFMFELVDGGKVQGPINDVHNATIVDALKTYKTPIRSKLQIQGIGRLNRYDRLERIESIHHISVIDPMDISSRLEDLKLIKDGWLDGEGVALSATHLDWLAVALEDSVATSPPYLYPTPDGMIRAEWRVNDLDISLDIDLAKRQGDWHAINFSNNEEQVRSGLDLNKIDSWKWIASQLTGSAT